MSKKQKKWIKSAFSQEYETEEPLDKKFKRSSSFTQNYNKTETTSGAFNIKGQQKSASTVSLLSSSSSSSSSSPSSSSSSRNKINLNSSNWIEYFAPTSLSELAIHPKKITEVKDWFLHYETTKRKYPSQILLISGPAGSGKTATVKVLAKEMQYDLVEWINPLDIELINDRDDSTIIKESQVDIFRRFLFRSSRYKSIFNSQDKRVILVEDFPNVFIKDPEGFNDILEIYYQNGKSPLIFITTDSKSKGLNIAYNLFPDHVRQQFNILHISFNPVSNTLIKKALKQACTIMSQNGFNEFYKIPNQEIIDSINLASQGDVRNAILNLHFASQKGSQQLQMDSQKQQKTASKKQKIGKKITSIGRDESITLMHALGRVFNPKYVEETNRLLHSPEVITEAFSTEPRNFLDFIQANYLNHFSCIEDVTEASECISQSDILLNEYRDNDVNVLGLNIAIRGVMVSNRKPVSGWMPVKGPYRMKKETSLEENLKKYNIKEWISRGISATDYRTYVGIIKSPT